MLRYHVAMSNTPVSSPDEVIALRAKVSEQAAEIEHLKLVIAKLRRMQFGRSSEQMNEMLGQLELSLEELETLRAETPAEPPAPADMREVPPPRKPLPDRKQWDGRPHPTTASTCQSGCVVNHSNRKERPPCRLRQSASIWPRTYFRSMG